MGFGSYDEDESRKIDIEETDSEEVKRKPEHEGEVDFEFDQTTENMIERLDSMSE